MPETTSARKTPNRPRVVEVQGQVAHDIGRAWKSYRRLNQVLRPHAELFLPLPASTRRSQSYLEKLFLQSGAFFREQLVPAANRLVADVEGVATTVKAELAAFGRTRMSPPAYPSFPGASAADAMWRSLVRTAQLILKVKSNYRRRMRESRSGRSSGVSLENRGLWDAVRRNREGPYYVINRTLARRARRYNRESEHSAGHARDLAERLAPEVFALREADLDAVEAGFRWEMDQLALMNKGSAGRRAPYRTDTNALVGRVEQKLRQSLQANVRAGVTARVITVKSITQNIEQDGEGIKPSTLHDLLSGKTRGAPKLESLWSHYQRLHKAHAGSEADICEAVLRSAAIRNSARRGK